MILSVIVDNASRRIFGKVNNKFKLAKAQTLLTYHKVTIEKVNRKLAEHLQGFGFAPNLVKFHSLEEGYTDKKLQKFRYIF